MKALVYEAPLVMTVRDVERPTPGSGEVLLRVAYSGICGSELSGFLGQNSLRTPPLIFGHELSGVVAATGSGAVGVEIGARVTVNPLVSCGRCEYCVTARHQLCRDRLLLGASLPGSNAEYVVVPATALEPVPDGLELSDASMAEPAACAVHAVALSGIGAEDSALVIGAGPIGLFIVQVLLAHGVTRVLVADRNTDRRRIASSLGATVVRDGDAELLADVRSETQGRGVQVAFDAAGTVTTRTNCVAATAPGGRVMLIGLHADQTTLPVNTLIRGEIALHGVFAYNPAAFRTALAWLAEGRLGLRDGVVEADLEDGLGWYQRLVEGDPATKVLLRPAGLAAARLVEADR
ncbi:galactitol-1-phosphate 5-dehydrogenase [Nocardioides sp.]|uniref:galactitol-1-phosphate 5-dehydrogenase n=1 Tax=Nocardioides sp. TaxID=35761 RepID=UPI002610A0A9|nr:galactitol-1-phosphate 5-dehydrogenase [Nocardioides sp.]MDI6912541.1 galactitol-1-phosphate 5-dehydrogenase [Nocardioides sp.]